eukprot:CAMPEP_0194534656 /NCGR_PEP_ID=MMETSP0253-20130528/72944_1 /TAXON_ID=2966 /ORGANISM="Noctiluca scintillans" /LENGTH=135 /DNA_ID=CAMNT_0039380353 /DNA_START=173 /DNA_END=580 /DNA_ORIENTATION=+
MNITYVCIFGLMSSAATVYDILDILIPQISDIIDAGFLEVCIASLIVFCDIAGVVLAVMIYRDYEEQTLPTAVGAQENPYQSLPKDDTVSHHFYSNVFGSNNSLQQARPMYSGQYGSTENPTIKVNENPFLTHKK